MQYFARQNNGVINAIETLTYIRLQHLLTADQPVDDDGTWLELWEEVTGVYFIYDTEFKELRYVLNTTNIVMTEFEAWSQGQLRQQQIQTEQQRWEDVCMVEHT